jgi:hypothetical protein
MVVVYRDDQEAADALAQQLRRDNDRLADENERLKAELAARPPADRRTRKEKRAAARQPKKAAGKQRPAATRTSRTPVRDWIVRILAGLVLGGAGAYSTGYVLYPAFNHGVKSLGHGVFSFVLVQVPVFLFVSPGLLGRWDYDASKDGTLTKKQRALSIAGGLLLVAFVAWLGSFEGSGD